MRARPVIVLIVACLSVLGGCESCRIGSVHASRIGGNSTRALAVEGLFPIVELERDWGVIEIATLTANYGCIIDWPDGAAPRCYVFDKPRHTRTMTKSWPSFLALIDALPDNVELDRVDKCIAAFAWGMPAEKQAELDGLLARKKLRLVGMDDARHVNIEACETRRIGVVYDHYQR